MARPATATISRRTQRRRRQAPAMPADRPPTNSVIATWEGGWRCRVTAAGFDLVVDEPESAGGTGSGPMPTEYLLAAMASCYALALRWSADKRGVRLPDLAVTATGTYDGARFCRLLLDVATSASAEGGTPRIQPRLRPGYLLH